MLLDLAVRQRSWILQGLLPSETEELGAAYVRIFILLWTCTGVLFLLHHKERLSCLSQRWSDQSLLFDHGRDLSVYRLLYQRVVTSVTWFFGSGLGRRVRVLCSNLRCQVHAAYTVARVVVLPMMMISVQRELVTSLAER